MKVPDKSETWIKVNSYCTFFEHRSRCIFVHEHFMESDFSDNKHVELIQTGTPLVFHKFNEIVIRKFSVPITHIITLITFYLGTSEMTGTV